MGGKEKLMKSWNIENDLIKISLHWTYLSTKVDYLSYETGFEEFGGNES